MVLLREQLLCLWSLEGIEKETGLLVLKYLSKLQSKVPQQCCDSGLKTNAGSPVQKPKVLIWPEEKVKLDLFNTWATFFFLIRHCFFQTEEFCNICFWAILMVLFTTSPRTGICGVSWLDGAVSVELKAHLVIYLFSHKRKTG